MSILKELGYTHQIPLDTAKQLFQTHLRIMDRASLKAYFGTQAIRSVRKIQRIARYATGTTSFKTLELSQDVQARKGYFELLGLASIEKRGPTYFLILKEASVVPNLSCHTDESVCGSDVSNESIPRISLSPYSIAALEEGVRGNSHNRQAYGQIGGAPEEWRETGEGETTNTYTTG